MLETGLFKSKNFLIQEPKRVMSVFKERVEKHKGELAELELQESMVDKEKPVSLVGK